MRPMIAVFLAVTLLISLPAPAPADSKLTVARELAEAAIRKFGGKAAAEGTEALTRRIMTASARYGDDAVEAALKRVGPTALNLADEAGEQGTRALKLLGQHGDDAAVWVLARPKALKLLAEHGDEIASQLIRHKGVAEPLLEGFGRSGAAALGAVNPQNGRRMAIMLESGDLAKLGRSPELMGVIARHGDRACDFIWRNKGALAVGTTLTAFLAHPEPFLDNASTAVGAVAKHAIQPAIMASGEAAGHAFGFLRYAFALLAVGGACVGFLAVRYPPVKLMLTILAKLCFKRAAAR